MEQLFRPSEDDYGVWQWEQGKITAYTDSVANTGWPDFAKAIRGVAEAPCARRGNSIYVVVRGPSWELAQVAAQNLGGHLATIEDAEENAFVRAIIDTSPLKTESESGAWIGLNDVASEGDWAWASGSDTPFRNWQPGEPNGDNEDYTDSDYVHMYYNGLWNDHKSDGTITIGVAEIPMNAVRFFDSDNDGVNDYREDKDGTDPNDPNSFNPLSKGLVAYYPFDGNANDESGYGNRTFLSGAVLTNNMFDEAASAYALKDAMISIENTTHLENTNDFSVSIWAKLQTNDPTWIEKSPWSPLIVKRDDYATMDWQLYYTRASHTLTFSVGAGEEYKLFSTSIQPLSHWNMVTLRRLGDTWSLFVNTILVATTSQALDIPTGDQIRIGAFDSDELDFYGSVDNARIYNRALTDNEVKELFYGEAYTDRQRQFIGSNASVAGHFSLAEYNANRANGQSDVTTNPSAFNLFTAEQYSANYSSGVSTGMGVILSNPSAYNLYTSNSIMDLRMNGLMVQKQGTNAVITFQPQTTTDLTQPFTNNGTAITNTIPMPGNKGFIRINAKP